MQDTTSSTTDEASTAPGTAPTSDPSFHARRGALYGFAATAFQFPDADVLADLRDDEVQRAVTTAAAALAADADASDSTDSDLQAAVQRTCERVTDASDDAVEAAYHALLGVPGDDGTYPVVPYEAHYSTSGDVNETQRRIATIVGLLERFDLEPHDAFDDRQDHVAVLLELMQVIATQRAVALENDDREGAEALAAAETTVLDEHLQGFGPALAHDVTEATADVSERPGLDVYVAAADLAAALVRWDDALHPDAPVVDSGDPAGAAVGDASDSGAPGAPGENGGARR